MRKLIVSMNITLDGYMSSADESIDWHFQHWVPEMNEALTEELHKADTLLLGRVTYDTMAGSWPLREISFGISREDDSYANMMNSYLKIVVSDTLVKTTWNNSKILSGDIVLEIKKLKKQPGKNIMLYGSGCLTNHLIRNNLVDEFHLWIHPVIEGDGKRLFAALCKRKNLQLTKTKLFTSGVLLSCYENTKRNSLNRVNEKLSAPEAED